MLMLHHRTADAAILYFYALFTMFSTEFQIYIRIIQANANANANDDESTQCNALTTTTINDC